MQPQGYRARRAGSARFATYYKVQRWDSTSLTWRDVQRAHSTESEAIAAFPTGTRCRVMEISEHGRRPLPQER